MSTKRIGKALFGLTLLLTLSLVLAACAGADEEDTAQTTTTTQTDTSAQAAAQPEEPEAPAAPEEAMAAEEVAAADVEVAEETEEAAEEQAEFLSTAQTYSAEIDSRKQRVHYVDPATSPPNRDSVIRVRSWDYNCFDPDSSGCTGRSNSFTHDSLTHWFADTSQPLVVGDSRPLPELAESWEFPNADTIRFHIRKGVKFQDVEPVNGREMLASDVKYSIERSLQPDLRYAAELGDIREVNIVDDYTVDIVFGEPYAPFMTLISQNKFRMHAPEVEEEFGDFKTDIAQIGTGPYQDMVYEVGVKISLTRNDNYWRGPNGLTGQELPYARKVYAIIIDDEAAAMAAYRSGLQDHGPAWRCWGWWSALDDHLVALSDRPDLVYHYHSTGGGMYANYHYGPRLEGIWENKKMRWAVAMYNDISCAAWCAVTGGIQDTRYVAADNPWFLPTDQLTPDGQQFYVNYPDSTLDLEKAQQYLSEAKAELGLPADEDVKSTLTIKGTDQSIIDIAGRYVADLKKVGFDLQLIVLDSADYTKINKGEFTGLTMSYNSGWQDADSLFYNRYYSESIRNFIGVNDPEMDELILKGRVEFDPQKRIEIYYELQKIQAEMQYDIAVPNWTNTNMFPEWIKNPGPQISANGLYETYRWMWADMDHPARQGYDWE